MKEYNLKIYDTFYILKDQTGKEVHRENIRPPTYTPDNPNPDVGYIHVPYDLASLTSLDQKSVSMSNVKTVYQTNDNKIFQDKASADRHSARIDLIAFLSKYTLNAVHTTSTMECILTLLESIPAAGLKELSDIIVRLK